MTTHVSTDAQTQAIPRASAPVVSAADADVPAPEPLEVPREESVQHMYEAGMASLDALHDRWAAALAELQEAPVTSGPAKAAA